jgi:hypothetical protein
MTDITMRDAMPRIGDDLVDVVRALGVGLFGVGFAMEVMADTQLGTKVSPR